MRGILGKVFGSLYDSGERDQYRVRIERTAQGSEVYVSHRGLQEDYEDSKKDRVTWRPRPSDPGLEAEMLSKIMLRLGASKDAAMAAAIVKVDATGKSTNASTSPTIAHLGSDGTSLTLDADYDTAWRRVGLALDRSGFTVENRDRKQGLYEVRLSDSDPDAHQPGFFARLFSKSKADQSDGLSRYHVVVLGLSKGNAQINVQDDKGQPSTNPTAKRIAKQLLDELN